MASCEHVDPGDQTVPNGGEQRREEEEEDGGGGGGEEGADVKNIQSHYLIRCPSPSNLSMLSESRFSMISGGSDADSIYMEPIHLSSAIAAKKIINEELPPRGVRVDSVPESMLESAEQLMVEDLYNRVKDMIDDRSPYNTPCVLDIQRAMVQDRLEAPLNPVDEVWPNIFIAEKSVAVNKARLKRMGITHIINAAHGTGVYTGAAFYTPGMSIQYLGIEVDDFPDSDISPHFRTTAEFLDEALLTHKGKVLVDSMMGVSRSAALVAAYLMIFHSMSIMEALGALRKKRAVCPNEGFLKQLRELNETLMEERDDDDDTLSQCSVIDARARARIFGEAEPEEDEDEDTDEDEEQSMVGVKAHSIMMEEEGDDTASLMSSVASSAAAAALKSGKVAARTSKPENPEGEELAALPGAARESGVGGEGGEEEDEDDDEDGVGGMIREWQRRNEKYQSDEWWEAQLNSEADGDDLDSLLGGRSDADGGDLESVTSDDVRALKERVKRRVSRRGGPPSEAASTSSCTSYADLWKQRLREIEEQAAARYRKNNGEEEEDSESDGGGGGPGLGPASGTARAHKKMDDEVASIMSDSSSMYNFCQKNKEKLTPLERWRVKRIQFGWNKKGEDGGDGSSVVSGLSGASGDTNASTSTSLEDVNLTAYQAWKMKQQKRLGEDVGDSKDEVLEMSRVGDGDSSKAKRRQQRREEIMERSRKNLEESQSMCGGFETESCVSAVPLSAFWAGAGVATGPPSAVGGNNNNNDDNMSMLSGRSSNISSVSQARGVRSAHHPAGGGGPTPPICPILPVPTVPGPGGEPMVNLASIQNWIANVVSETLVQRQNEMMGSLPPPSLAGSVLGYGGGGGASSVVSGRAGGPAGTAAYDDRRSVISGASSSYASDLSRARAAAVPGGGGAARAQSVLSGSRLSSASSAVRSTLDSTCSTASKKKPITTTSVPLFSLFQDQVDLKKLDHMEKEIKSEFRGVMATYEKKKILEDNRHSTLYKKKKPKEEDDEDEEEADERKRREEEFLAEATRKAEKPRRSYGLSGCLNLSTALEKGKETNVDDWLRSVRPPPRKGGAPTTTEDDDRYYDDLDGSASEFDYSSRRASYAIEEEEEEGYAGGRSRYRSSPEPPPPLYRRTPLDATAEPSPSNGFSSRGGYAGRADLRSYGESGGEGTDGGYGDFSTKRKYGHLSEATEAARPNRRVEAEAEEEEEDVEAFIAQTRQRIRARALAEAEDDEVLSAWREQQETKSRSRGEES